jgi:hypothetical protein
VGERNELQKQPGQEVAAPVQQQPAKPVIIDVTWQEVSNAPAEEAQQAPRQASPKIGEGHWEGMLRLGLKELAQALPAFPDSTVRPVEEAGVFGNATPQIVTDQMGYDPAEYIRPQTPGKEQDKGRSR